MRGPELIDYIFCWILITIDALCCIGMVTRYAFRKDAIRFYILFIIGIISSITALAIALHYL